MLITSVFSSSKNGHKNAVASNPYWQVLPTADSGYKNNTPLKRAATESYSIHERLLKNGYSVLPLHYLAQNSHLIFLLSSICQNRFILTYHSRFTTTFQYVKEDISWQTQAFLLFYRCQLPTYFFNEFYGKGWNGFLYQFYRCPVL